MGYWGYEPKDGDGPEDLFAIFSQRTQKVTAPEAIEYVLKKRGFPVFERVGFIELLLQHGFSVDRRHIEWARNTLEELLEDEEFVQNWKSPSKFVQVTKQVIKELERSYARHSRR